MNFYVILLKLTILFFTIHKFSNLYAEEELKYVHKKSFYEIMPAGKKGGVLRFIQSSDPKVMNPLLSDDSESSAIEGFLWMSLFNQDPQTLNFLPALAKNYFISKDKKEYTFILDERAKWQDETSVTTEDIKFTFDTLMNKNTKSAALRTYFEGVKLTVKDKYTFVFHVDVPKFNTINTLVSFVPIQKKQFEKSSDFNSDPGIMKPIGNGPYLLSSYSRGQNIVLKRNLKWWAANIDLNRNRFNVDEVQLIIITQPNLAYEKFINGDIDDISFTSEQWNNKVKGIDKNKFSDKPNDTKLWAIQHQNKFPKPYSYIAWNLKNPLFSDKKVRTALSYLVDYNRIMDKVYFNLYTRCTSPFGSFTDNSDPNLRSPDKIISFNPKKGLELLKESGWKNNGNGVLVKEINGKLTPFEFSLETNTNNPGRIKIAEILKETFKNYGIKVNIKSSEWNTFIDNVEKKNFEAIILAWTGSIRPDAKQIWDSSSANNDGSNFVSYNNPKVDELIKIANTEFDIKKRNKIMQEINRLIYEDQPYTFLGEMNYILEGLNPKIKSSRWIADYESGAAWDMFYFQK